jgi:hypothetical protein
MSQSLYPEEFMDLAALGEEWCIADQHERHLKRLKTARGDIERFYTAILPRLSGIIDYLDRFPLDGMPPDAKRLFDLALTAMEMSHPIDLHWATNDIDDAFPPERLIPLPVPRLANNGLPG